MGDPIRVPLPGDGGSAYDAVGNPARDAAGNPVRAGDLRSGRTGDPRLDDPRWNPSPGDPGPKSTVAVSNKSVWGEVGAAIIAAIAKLLLARVQKEFSESEKKLPAPPEGQPVLGLPEEFAGKLVRKYYSQIATPAFTEAVVEEVVSAFKAGHGPTRRNRVALAAAQPAATPDRPDTRPAPVVRVA